MSEIGKYETLYKADIHTLIDCLDVSKTEELYISSRVLPLGAKFNIEWLSMSFQEKNTQRQRGYLIAIVIVFAYLFLVAQYERFIVPLVIASGAAAQSRIAIGVPVFYGMIVVTIVGLFIIPLMHVWVQTIYEKYAPKRKKKK